MHLVVSLMLLAAVVVKRITTSVEIVCDRGGVDLLLQVPDLPTYLPNRRDHKSVGNLTVNDRA